jgi:hypothetical protein
VAGFFEPQARRYNFRSSLFRHAPILRGKYGGVNSAFTAYRCGKSIGPSSERPSLERGIYAASTHDVTVRPE